MPRESALIVIRSIASVVALGWVPAVVADDITLTFTIPLEADLSLPPLGGAVSVSGTIVFDGSAPKLNPGNDVRGQFSAAGAPYGASLSIVLTGGAVVDIDTAEGRYQFSERVTNENQKRFRR